MRLHFLRAGPQRVAFDYSLSYKNRIHLLKLGYDPAYAPYSPSNLLLVPDLAGHFRAGRRHGYDFLGESADWKLQWTKRRQAQLLALRLLRQPSRGACCICIKSQFVPLLKHNSLQPLRNLVLRLVAHGHSRRGHNVRFILAGPNLSRDFCQTARSRALPFPLNSENRLSFCVSSQRHLSLVPRIAI